MNMVCSFVITAIIIIHALMMLALFLLTGRVEQTDLSADDKAFFRFINIIRPRGFSAYYRFLRDLADRSSKANAMPCTLVMVVTILDLVVLVVGILCLFLK